MSTEKRAIRAARRGAVSAIIGAAAEPAFALTAPVHPAPTQTVELRSASSHVTALPAAAARDTVGQIAKGLLIRGSM